LNTGKKIALWILLTTVPALLVPAQTQTQTDTIPSIFESKKVPQWTKDLRRWEIVAFGSIPFTLLFSSFAVDMYRWQKANGMDFSADGRRYAPWPMKSAGAVGLTRREQEMVFIIAASLSVSIAMTDLLIVQIKRRKARKRAEALPAGTAITTPKPWSEEEGEAQDGAGINEEPVEQP